MKIKDVDSFAITYKDVMGWLDNRPVDEVYTPKEMSDKLGIRLYSLAHILPNVGPEYRYRQSQNYSYYGNKKAILKITERKRSIFEG